jgi:hypothetical protein
MDSTQLPGDPDPMPPAATVGAEHTFTAQLWLWDARQQDTWTFVTVPADITAVIEDAADARGPRAGFGSVKVRVRMGSTTWRTSVFPDSASGCFVLPIKRSVRAAQGVAAGDTVTLHLQIA